MVMSANGKMMLKAQQIDFLQIIGLLMFFIYLHSFTSMLMHCNR